MEEKTQAVIHQLTFHTRLLSVLTPTSHFHRTRWRNAIKWSVSWFSQTDVMWCEYSCRPLSTPLQTWVQVMFPLPLQKAKLGCCFFQNAKKTEIYFCQDCNTHGLDLMNHYSVTNTTLTHEKTDECRWSNSQLREANTTEITIVRFWQRSVEKWALDVSCSDILKVW